PGGEELEIAVLAGEHARRAAGRIGEIETPQRLEDDAPSVRRDGGEARHAGGEAFLRDLDRRVRRIDDDAVVGDLERHHRRLAAVDAVAADLAARPEADRPAVGGPEHHQIDALEGTGVQQVLIEIVIYAPLVAGAQI